MLPVLDAGSGEDQHLERAGNRIYSVAGDAGSEGSREIRVEMGRRVHAEIKRLVAAREKRLGKFKLGEAEKVKHENPK
jgi:hypothetical protein